MVQAELKDIANKPLTFFENLMKSDALLNKGFVSHIYANLLYTIKGLQRFKGNGIKILV